MSFIQRQRATKVYCQIALLFPAFFCPSLCKRLGGETDFRSGKGQQIICFKKILCGKLKEGPSKREALSTEKEFDVTSN